MSNSRKEPSIISREKLTLDVIKIVATQLHQQLEHVIDENNKKLEHLQHLIHEDYQSTLRQGENSFFSSSNTKVEIQRLIKMNNNIYTIIAHISEVSYFSEQDYLSIHNALTIKKFADQMSDYEFDRQIKNGFYKILTLEKIRNPDLASPMEKIEHGLFGLHKIAEKQQAEIKHETLKEIQKQSELEIDWEESDTTPKQSRCVIC